MAKNTENNQEKSLKEISESLKKLVKLKLIELSGGGTIVKEESLLNKKGVQS